MSPLRTPIRMGVAGVGSLGFHHARILRDLPDVEMAGFFDVDAPRADFVSRELGLRPTESLQELVAMVDALVVAVPTSCHEEVALAAVERGVHVLIEKPLAPTLEAADRILAAAQEAGAVVQTGHVERFNGALRAAAPYIGAPLFIESHRLAPFGRRGTDVAVVLDLMIHDVDLVCMLVKAPVAEIAAAGIPVLTPSVDIANARLTFKNGAVANLTASRVSGEGQRMLRVFQRSGYLRIDLARGRGEFLRLRHDLPALLGEAAQARVKGRGTARSSAATPGLDDIVERIPFQGLAGEPLQVELEGFRDAALGRREPIVSGGEGRAALEITLCIEKRILDHVAHSRTS